MRNKIKIRTAKMEDIPEIIIVEEEAWPEGLRATEEMFRSRIETFPEGTLVAENTSRIIGVVATEIIKYVGTPLSWYDITDNGSIRGTHDPNGDTLYGVDLSVSPYSLRGVSRSLLLAVGKFVIARNLKRILFGARIPRYHKFCHRMNPEEYIKARTNSGKILDPELGFYVSIGLQITELLPDYIKDPDSCNYGVLLLWQNPFYQHPLRKLWSWLFRI